MREDLALLYELQQADTGIAERVRELAGLDDGTAAREELAAAEAELAAAEEKLRADRTTLRDKELRLASTEEERDEKHQRCYGGMVSDPKELSALERKIEELTTLIGKLEEEILVLMDQVEEEEAQVDRLRKRVEQLRTRVRDTEEHYRMDKERLQSEISQLQTRREELAEKIDGQLLRMYEQLRQRLGGVAVAAVVDYTCSVCHTAVPRDTVDRIASADMPIRCESCHRILWRPE